MRITETMNQIQFAHYSGADYKMANILMEKGEIINYEGRPYLVVGVGKNEDGQYEIYCELVEDIAKMAIDRQKSTEF